MTFFFLSLSSPFGFFFFFGVSLSLPFFPLGMHVFGLILGGGEGWDGRVMAIIDTCK